METDETLERLGHLKNQVKETHPVLHRLLTQIIDSFTVDTSGDDPRLFAKGKFHGRLLIPDTSLHLQALEEEYATLGELLNSIANTELAQVQHQAKIEQDQLEQELKQINEELDTASNSSKIAILYHEISEIKREVSDYKLQNQENFYFKKYYEVFEEALDNHLSFAKNTVTDHKDITSNISLFQKGKEQKKYHTHIVEDDYDEQPLEIDVHDNPKTFWQKIVSYLWRKESQSVYEKERDIEWERLKRKQELLDEIRHEQGDIYETALNKIKQATLIPPKSQIILKYVMAFIILMGEIYLVAQVLTDVLGFSIPNNLLTYFTNPINLTIPLFCIAYPLAIGMLIKYRYYSNSDEFEDNNQEAKNFLKSLLRVVFVAIPFIAIVASWKIWGGDALDLPISDNILVVIKIVLVGFFLATLTLVLASMGSIFLIEAWALHKKYRHATYKSLIRWRFPWHKKRDEDTEKDIIAEKQSEIDKRLKQVDALKEKKEIILKSLLKVSAIAATSPKPYNYQHLVNALKCKGKSLYLSGYELGRAEKMESTNLSDLVITMKKREFLQKIRSATTPSGSNHTSFPIDNDISS